MSIWKCFRQSRTLCRPDVFTLAAVFKMNSRTSSCVTSEREAWPRLSTYWRHFRRVHPASCLDLSPHNLKQRNWSTKKYLFYALCTGIVRSGRIHSSCGQHAAFSWMTGRWPRRVHTFLCSGWYTHPRSPGCILPVLSALSIIMETLFLCGKYYTEFRHLPDEVPARSPNLGENVIPNYFEGSLNYWGWSISLGIIEISV